MPNLTLPIQAPKASNDTSNDTLTQGMDKLSVDIPSQNKGCRTPTTKLKHNSKSFKPRFLQNRNTGGK